MNCLQNKTVYLGGPIQNDTGPDWRPPVRDALKKFGLNVIDPFIDEKQKMTGPLNQAILAKDYDRIAEISEGFVRKDLGLVDRCDFVISNLVYKVATYGTTEEIITAWRAKKPVILVCEAGKEKIPAWFYGYIHHQDFMYGSFNEAYQYLERVNQDKEQHQRRWSYVYGLI